MSLLVELLMNASRVGERRVPVLDLAGNRVSEITLPKTFLAPAQGGLGLEGLHTSPDPCPTA